MKYVLLSFLIAVLIAQEAHAQRNSGSTLYRIVTNDGNQYIGEIVVEDEETIKLKTKNIGEITILKEAVRSREAVIPDQIKAGEVWHDNPQSTRYLWSPNGFGLKKGEGYYQNVWVFFNHASYGVTDNFSIGAGLLPGFLFAGGPTPVWVTPKFSLPIAKDNFNLGVGALAGTVVGAGNGDAFGVVYGIGTLGSRDKNISVGLGYGFIGGELASTPAFTVSGMLRIAKGGYLLTENYFLDVGDENATLISLGGRAMIGTSALDFGLFFPIEAGFFIGIPWLGISIPFGN